MKPKFPDIAILMFKLDTEIGELNRTQNRITELKDKIWTMMRDNNLSYVCYDGRFSASARGKSLITNHGKMAEVER